MAKECPMMGVLMRQRGVACIGKHCAWWCEFANQCAIPLMAEILADSDICNNVFGKVYTAKDGDNDG